MEVNNNSLPAVQQPRLSIRRALEFSAAEEVFTSIVPGQGESSLGKRKFTGVHDGKELCTRGKHFFEQKKWDGAIKKAYDKDESEAGKMIGIAYYEKGLITLHDNQYNESLSWFQEALKYCPECAQIWHHLGCAQMQLNDYILALENFDTALKYDPAFAPAWAEKGKIAMLQRDWDDAITYFKLAYAINNSNKYRDLLVTTYLGFASITYSDRRKAITYYDEVLALDGDNLKALKGKGLLLLKEKRLEEGVAALDKAYELGSVTSELNTYSTLLAGEALKIQDFAKVRHYQTIVLKIFPTNHTALLHRGIANYKLGLYQDAIFDLMLVQDSLEGRTYLGPSLLGDKRYAASIRELNRAIALMPDNSFLKEQLKEAHEGLNRELRSMF